MAEADTLDVAIAGDRIDGKDLQDSIDGLLAIEAGMNDLKAKAGSMGELDDIGAAQQKLRSMAIGLVNQQIDLIAGHAKITADHINAATEAAQGKIAKIAEVRKSLETVGMLLDFFATVLTGNGQKIVEAAFALKDQLDAV